MLSYLEPVKQRVSQTLRDFFATRRAKLSAVSPLGADAGDRLLDFALQGKMIRASLVSLGFAICSRTAITDAPPAAIMAGAAMELFQSGLLVHDDIMDRDLTRRGRATIFHQYAQAATRQNHADPGHVGEALGMCAGDVAFFLAFELLSVLPVPEPVRVSLLGMCARELTAVGVAQMQDVAWSASQAPVEDTEILTMYCYKTGRYSFSLPLMAGGLLAGADAAVQGRVESIGEAIGILFQIRDDELGLFGDEKEIGKPIGSDVREGKKTLLYARLMEKAQGRDRAKLARLFGNRDATRRDLEYVRAKAVALGVKDSLEATTREIRERALVLIDSMETGAGAEKDRLRELLDFAVSREAVMAENKKHGTGAGRSLSSGFRRRNLQERGEEVRRTFDVGEAEWEGIMASASLMEIADVMVESAIGCIPMPLGIAEGFLVDGRDVAVPMAVEEPSVIAAASFAARLVRRAGGFTTWAAEPVMTAQVFLEGVPEDGAVRISSQEGRVRALLASELASLERRGGGFRGMSTERLPSGTIRVDLKVDVRDSQGANRLNTAAEAVRPILEAASGGRALMAVLTNAARDRVAGARYALPVSGLGMRLPAGMSAAEAGRRIAAASAVAQEDPSRAVTHNKGIMNGISALALATMNDTRSVEAAAHAWACRDGTCRGLSTHRVQNGILHGEISLPLPLAAAGGSVDFHPAARASMEILGNPDGPGLARIAAALGLAQNLAALLALVTHGIQAGHMRLGSARLAWLAGARGAEARHVAEILPDAAHADLGAVRDALARLRRGTP